MMTRAAEILDYLSSRASIKSADIKEGARKAFGLAYDLFWSPVTVPKAVVSYGLGLTPVRALVLTPLHLLQRSNSDGKLIHFTMLNASGKPVGIQPVWAQWNYKVENMMELLEKHLDLQEKKDVWIENVGITQKGIFRNSYTFLPKSIPVKDFALPWTCMVAVVEKRPSATADAMLTTKAPNGLEQSPGASPEKTTRKSKEFFILPADSRFGGKSLALSSHPIPANLTDGSSDADSPTHSPMSNPDKTHFSPFQ